jgi:glycine betaine/proline transport system ATP-binding protein
MTEPVVVCQDIWKIFGAAPKRFLAKHDGCPSAEVLAQSGYIAAVRNASLEAYPGEIVVIMGLSGSGKSTLVRCLSRLITPTAGKVFFQGISLLEASDRELVELRRHKMGMVFQNFALLPHRTVLDNVAFPLEIQGVDRAKRHAQAREIIELVGLKGREGYYPRELSGGQQQRVGIARSLAVEPDVWFLDEPFSALDPLIRREMQNEFLRLQNIFHKTIFFITHDFDEAIRVADRIAIMNEGEIVQLGTAEELVLNPVNNYVREFIRDIPVGKLLTAGSVMGAPASNSDNRFSIKATELIFDVAARVLDHDVPVSVVDENGRLVGSLSRDQVVEVIFSRGT